jgi:hypothetical protein
MIGNYPDSTMVSIFRGTDQPPTRSALLTANWRGRTTQWVGPPVFDRQILPLDIAGFAQSLGFRGQYGAARSGELLPSSPITGIAFC